MMSLGLTGRRVVMGATTTTTALAGGAAAAVYYQQQQQKSNKDGSDLVLPTLQAAARVMRLAGTCVLMTADYKTAAFWSPSTIRNQQPKNDERSKERVYWEQQLGIRKQAFEDAQEKYSTNDLPGITNIQDRVHAKRSEKQIMQNAAERLAEAEEQLAGIGSSTMSLIHKKAAQRLLDLCHANRGVYIKVGQHLANLDYLIPSEYIETLSALYDDNPVTSYKDVYHVIREDLGANPEELFDSFDPVPIASASLAQVHVAYKDGKKLAIKVQHRGLRETSKGDIFSLETAVRTAERIFPDFSFGWLANEIAPNLPKELDFQNEGRNAEKAEAHIRETGLRCIIPKILWDMTSPRVLTMEFEEGFKATDIASIEQAGLKKHDVAKLISSVFASQVFESGHVHCDPHEANVLLRAEHGKPVMVLVDHGLYKSLDADFRRQYAALWKSLMLADLSGIKDACRGLGIENDEAYRLFAGILTARPFDEIVERSKDGGSLRRRPNPDSRSDQAIIRGYAQRFLPNIIALLSVIPRQMLLLLKMNDCLRHIDYVLGSPANTLLVTGHFAARALYKDSLAASSSMSWLERVRAWWSYVRVVTRIQIHETSLWWLQAAGKL